MEVKNSNLREIMWTSSAILLALLVVVYAGIHPRKQAPLCKNCNVILISIDTLGEKHTSLDNPSLNTTPFFLSLAQTRGVIFDEAYVNAPWTLPSHTAMFTGEYPWNLGVWTTDDKVPERAKTIAHTFETSGYHTVGFSDGGFVQPLFGLTNGIEEFTGSQNEADWNDLPVLFKKGSAWITSYKEPKPFYLLMRPFEVHDPYGVPNTPGALTIEDIVRVNTQPGGATPEEGAEFRTAYHKEISLTDSALKDFFTAFDTSPYASNTVIVITADHGEEFGEHGSVGMHGTTDYREVIHVPLVFIIPHVPPHRVTSTVEERDIPKTLLEIVGNSTSRMFSGVSLVPALRGEQMENELVQTKAGNGTREQFLANIVGIYQKIYEWGSVFPPKERVQAFTLPYVSSALKGKWHVIKQRDGHLELYNMMADPDEQNDLYPSITSLSLFDRVQIQELIRTVSSK